jgi:hypothetical protein
MYLLFKQQRLYHVRLLVADCLLHLLPPASLFPPQIQTLDIPGEVKAGYSPIGFVRCGRAACKITKINWKVRTWTLHKDGLCCFAYRCFHTSTALALCLLCVKTTILLRTNLLGLALGVPPACCLVRLQFL